MLRRRCALTLAVVLLGCRVPATVTTAPEADPEAEPAGIEPVASGSLVQREGRVGPDPDAPEHDVVDAMAVPGPLARFSGERLDSTIEPDGLVITHYALGTGPAAQIGDIVRFHYVGTLQDGTQFDSSYARNMPFSFDLGGGKVIPGLDRGLVGARAGMLRVLSIPAALGYGDRGAGGTIPANSTLLFYIEVIAIEPPSP
jgi:hypothetical protein